MKILQRKKAAAKKFGKTERWTFASFAFDHSKKQVGDLSAEKRFVGNYVKNCRLKQGALCRGVGLAPLTVGETEVPSIVGVTAAKFFSLPVLQDDGTYVEKLGIVDTNGILYYYEDGATSFVADRLFGAGVQPIVAMDKTGKTYPLFAGNGGLWYATDENVSAVIDGGVAPIACVFKDRVLCVIEPFTVAYSAALAPTDFADSIDDSGKISFPSEKGKIVGLLPFQECVYIFYEYGVSKWTLAGRAREFTMEKVEYNGGRIVQGSMGVCALKGEKAFFLAEDGLYSFDGKTAKRICESLCVKPKKGIQVCNHAASLGYFFLGFETETGAKTGFVVDVEREEGYYTFPLEGLSTCRGKAVCLSEKKVRSIENDGDYPSGFISRFDTIGARFGTGVKTLKTLVFTGEGAVSVTVRCGYKTVRKRIEFQNGRASMRVWLRGETFDFVIALEKGSVVRRLDVELGVCEYAEKDNKE